MMKALMGPATLPVPEFVLDDIIRHAREGPAGRFLQTLDEWGPYLLDDRLDEVVVPVELVWGDGDDLWTLDVAQRLLDGLPRARLHPVHGCGHVPHRECPDKTLEALQTALAMPPPELTVDDQHNSPTRFAGRVVFVHPQIDPVNGYVRVWAEIDNRQGSLSPGMRAKNCL